MTIVRDLVTYMVIKTNDDELKKTNKNIDQTQQKMENFNQKAEESAKQASEDAKRRDQEEKQRLAEKEKRYKNLRNAFLAESAIMVGATKKAIDFERSLADIQKVNLHIDLKEAEKSLMNMSKYASGKSLTDLGVAYKTFAQTLKNQGDIEGMMKLTERGSIAYDMSAAETATALSIIRNNLQYTNDDVERLGDKISYSHHQYGNAQVPDIFAALQDLSGVMLNTGVNEDFATTYATTLLNAGFEQSEVGRSFSRLMQRLSMGEYWEGREAFQKAGREAGIDMVKLANELVKGQKDGSANDVLIKFFGKMAQAQAQGKNTQAIWGLLGGNNYARQFQLIGALFQSNFLDLYDKLTNAKKADGTPIYAGEQQRAYDIVNETLSRQLLQLKNTFERVSIEIAKSNLPALTASVKGLIKILNFVTDKGFTHNFGLAFTAMFTASAGRMLLMFGAKHAGLFRALLLPFGPMGTALAVLVPAVITIAELLHERFGGESEKEGKERAKNENEYNQMWNDMSANSTPVDMRRMTLEGLTTGSQNAEKSFAAGLFQRIDPDGTRGLNKWRLSQNQTLNTSITVNAQYGLLQNQIDAEKANDDLVSKIAERITKQNKNDSTKFSGDSMEKLRLSLEYSN